MLSPAEQQMIRNLKNRQRLLNQEVLMYQGVMIGLRRGLSLDGLLKLIIRSIQKGLGFKRCGIFFLEADGKHIELAMGVDIKGRFERKKDRLPITRRRGVNLFSDLVNGYQKYFLTNHVDKRVPRRLRYRVPVKGNAAVPIQVGRGKTIGVLTIENLNANRVITLSDVTRLMNYATQVGLSIESLKNQEETLNLAITDPLTGLYNRRYFEKTLQQEIKRCQRYRRSFSLLIADLDHFKHINDTYGHDQGDEVLKQAAALLRDNVRTLDMVARIGGEEFAVLLPETPPNNISVVMKRLLRTLREARPAVAEMAAKGQRVTVSIGAACYKRGPATLHQVFRAADQSLYQAKTNGRNRSGSVKVITD